MKHIKMDMRSRNISGLGSYPREGRSLKITHVAAFALKNAGDLLLPVTMKDLFHIDTAMLNWHNIHVHRQITRRKLSQINKSHGLLIGGGGLFLSDTNKNYLSGWQWSCSVDDLKKINVPLAIFAVGYNRFRGQDEFPPLFKRHINILAEKSRYIALRNSGSIDAVSEYLHPDHHDKLRYQPCMTTLITELYPHLKGIEKEHETIALNCAFDRPEMRFGDRKEEQLNELAQAAAILGRKNKLLYYSHQIKDEAMCTYLDRAGADYEIIRLNKATPEEIMTAYCRVSLVMAMRGHSQMIPFGCRTPVISLISHDKLRFFLNDIDRNDWGIEMQNKELREILIHKAEQMLRNKASIINDIGRIQKELLKYSYENVRDFISAAEEYRTSRS